MLHPQCCAQILSLAAEVERVRPGLSLSWHVGVYKAVRALEMTN